MIEEREDEQFSINVELNVISCSVTYAHRSGASVAFEMIESDFFQVLTTCPEGSLHGVGHRTGTRRTMDSIHNLQRTVRILILQPREDELRVR